MSGFSTDNLRALARAVRELDPDGQYVKLDVDVRQVFYSSTIKQHEAIRDYVGDEEPVRAYFVAWLCTRGSYPPEAIELERRYSFGRESQLEVDIRISRPGMPDAAYALIEMKAPSDFGDETDSRISGQLFAPGGREPSATILSLATVEVGSDGQPAIRTVTIGYDPLLTYEQWEAAGRQHVDDFPINYDEPTQEPLRHGGPRALRASIDRTELDRLRKQLHDRLWGGSRDDNQIYSWLVRLFLTKIHDERVTNVGEPYKFQVLHQGSRKEQAKQTLVRVNERYLEAYQRYIRRDGQRVDLLEESLFSPQETQWVVELLQGISLTNAGRSSGDLLGAFFEGITREGFKQSKGLFFTHYNIAVFMLEVLEVGQLAEAKFAGAAHPNERLPYIIDPSCGSGTFLLAAMRTITQHILQRSALLDRNADVREQLSLRFPPEAPNTWAKDFIYGIEKREDLAISTKVNMVLHRDGHTHVFNDDGLAPLNSIASRHGEEKFRSNPDPDGVYDKPLAESFDVVVTNPPFSITLDANVRADLSSAFRLAQDRNSENLFLERWYQLLRPGGRLGAVLPESFFSTTENLAARLFLFERFHVRAVVTLPSHSFQPWTPTRTSLLFAQKKTAKEERDWTEAFTRHSVTLKAAQSSAAISAKSIVKPGRRAQAQIASHRLAVDAALTELEVGQLLEEHGTVAWAAEALAATSSINTDVLAFRRTVAEIGAPDYTGIIVGEVGYRRTKRAENDRRNDLFRAVLVDSGGNPVVDEEGKTVALRNLNDAADGWAVVIGGGAEDALSVLRAEKLWR
ncbi:class I SAM-dependent DNA methyltransferase [Micromonospora sp. NPDC051543]|uniref:class I SAM-dependent DNA methyltransferase n=1 Tax=Micromonospora sp. NPDC051543 TaxID=3364287 RepID=UPI0037A2C902